jgi:hypothetical protein
MKNVFSGSHIEKVIPFEFDGNQFYGELHCFSGWFVSDSNRMEIDWDLPAFNYFVNHVLPEHE